MLKYTVTDMTNFCRVFELPDSYPEGFLFGGGKPVMLMMIDWFNPVSGRMPVTLSLDVSGEHNLANWANSIIQFVKEKPYCIKGKSYLILTDFGHSMTFTR